jgi:hypothetical protein
MKEKCIIIAAVLSMLHQEERTRKELLHPSSWEQLDTTRRPVLSSMLEKNFLQSRAFHFSRLQGVSRLKTRLLAAHCVLHLCFRRFVYVVRKSLKQNPWKSLGTQAELLHMAATNPGMKQRLASHQLQTVDNYCSMLVIKRAPFSGASKQACL